MRRLRLDNLGPQPNLPLVVLGDSDTAWGATPLPLDLAPFGWPGCRLHTSPLVSFPLADLGGFATWSGPIPNDPAWIGLTVFCQGALGKPSPSTLVTSNACRLRFGAR